MPKFDSLSDYHTYCVGSAGQSLSKGMAASPGLTRRAIEQEQEYWQRLGNVVDDKLLRVYGALERNLQSYHQLLKTRASGLREVSER